jgi:pyruvate dehydrogenase E1 component
VTIEAPPTDDARTGTGTDWRALEDVEQRVLWLATRIIDAANHERANTDGIKVGGHQASSASMVSIMTALWFCHLGPDDLVSVKPHASPVLHAINYLLGGLDESRLSELRAYQGLQAYPSRTKDHDRVDFSTGSVGLGATAPLFAAAARRYVDCHFGPRPRSRFVALLGDAELDEGNVWEALFEPSLAGLGDVVWVVDLNRQSLDRVVPGIKVHALQRAFSDAGWHVLDVKYGRQLEAAFARPGGAALRRRIDEMPNDEYQHLFGLTGAEARTFFCGNDPALTAALAPVADDEVQTLLTNLGGHDLRALCSAFAEADAVMDRPSILFAYTVKGWGLEMAGDPLNHSSLLTTEQIDRFRLALAIAPGADWARPDPESPAGRLCTATTRRLGGTDAQGTRRNRARPVRPLSVPHSVLGTSRAGQRLSTQEAFGRALTGLGRSEAGERLVTVSPDVSVSTNLGGWINKVGVFTPVEEHDWLGESRPLRWRQSPQGQHIELGISEMNLFSMLTQLGLTWDLSDEVLLPIGTVYDPFVCRGLDAFIYGAYNGARFVVAGTPSGVTLAPEGGAHQSTITASIGMELPGVDMAEPAFATPLDWLLCDALATLANAPDPVHSLYLRLSTRPIDQTPFLDALERCGEAELRRHVLAGGYRLREPQGETPMVQLVGSGAVLPEVVEAAALLADEGVPAAVIDVTSADRLYAQWARRVRSPLRDVAARPPAAHVSSLLLPGVPIVTVHDAASHAMAWLGSVHGSRTVPLGVDEFGQSGTIPDLYRQFDLDAAAVVNAALWAIELG